MAGGAVVAGVAVVRVWRVLCDPGLRGLVVPRGASGVKLLKML